MKEILVLSDSHKNILLLKSVLEKENEADIIIHLGDYYEDLNPFVRIADAKKFYRVPGIYHNGYRNGTLKNVQRIKIAGFGFLFAHTFEDLSKNMPFEKFNLYGHTHKAELFGKRNIFINPGHLKAKVDRGYPASYGKILIDNKKIEIKIIDINGETIKEYMEETNDNRRN